MSCRLVQNGELTFENVFIPDSDKLPKADDFKTASSSSLYIGRMYVTFLSIGAAFGCLREALAYIKKR
jgi:alkylation response protein AidB-like acyl-CoA dehydrogenase